MPPIRLLTIPAQQIGTLLTESWSAFRGTSRYTDVPPLDASLRIVGEAVLDRTFTLFTNLMLGVPHPDSVRQMVEEGIEARALYEERGWLADPASFHQTPPAVEESTWSDEATWDGPRRRAFGHITFESGYEPHPGEPGRERWLENRANRLVHAYVLEHPGAPRPWLVCVHGFAMGTPMVNFSGFQVKRLHDELGLNLIFPCLPLHGPRSRGRFSGAEVLAPDYMNLVHLFAQGAWDIRRTLSWLRRRRAPRIGLYGVSLGGYTAALTAGLEEGLHCIFASIPPVDFTNLARDNEPWIMSRYYDDEVEMDWQLIRTITHVVSPLALPCRVPKGGRFIIAGVADRVVRPYQPRALWRHWEEPAIHWFSGGHVAGQFKTTIADFLDVSLRSAGMTPARPPDRGQAAAAGA